MTFLTWTQTGRKVWVWCRVVLGDLQRRGSLVVARHLPCSTLAFPPMYWDDKNSQGVGNLKGQVYDSGCHRPVWRRCPLSALRPPITVTAQCPSHVLWPNRPPSGHSPHDGPDGRGTGCANLPWAGARGRGGALVRTCGPAVPGPRPPTWAELSLRFPPPRPHVGSRGRRAGSPRGEGPARVSPGF